MADQNSGFPDGPLQGLRILDLSTVIMGPYASMLLADLGADVIKIESGTGDPLRYYKPQRSTEMSGMFLTVHRNKRSVVINLKQPSGKAAFMKLVAGADVVLHNFRPAVAARLGITYQALKACNERIVLCKAYGFGEGGPYAEKPAYDDVIQASSGLADAYAKVQGEPRYVPSMIADKMVGLNVAQAILAGCYGVLAHGRGSEIEVPMFESMVSFNLVENLSAATFVPSLGPVGWSRNMSPMRKPFRTRDGYACLLPYTDDNWRDFFAFAGQDNVLDDERFRTLADRAANIDALYKIVEAVAPLHATSEWLAFCEAHGIPCAPVNRMDDLPEDPHVRAVGLFQEAEHPTEGRYRLVRSPIRFAGRHWSVRRHAPALGEHTEDVLREAGVSEEDIRDIKAGTGAAS